MNKEFVFVMHYFVSILVLQSLKEEEKAGCFTIIVLQITCHCKCSVVLPHGAVGWSAVYDSCIS